MDIILGAVAFRPNDLHLYIPEVATEPGKKNTEPDTAKNVKIIFDNTEYLCLVVPLYLSLDIVGQITPTTA